jgi:tryptophan 2,3-dioxygenase
MTPMDFLDFRDMLRPASGFQSWQFKIIEAKLGLKFEQRHGQNYYTSQLSEEDIKTIKSAEEEPSILMLINQWLERMPFLNDKNNWANIDAGSNHEFWNAYENIFTDSLSDAEKNNSTIFKQLFYGAENTFERNLSPEACRSALFIMLYRGFPLLELPFQLLDVLLEIDNQLGSWRYRHINMVKRMIGSRVGTGGSTGAGYLQGAMDKHYIFKEISQLNSFLIDRRKLPVLPNALIEKLGYQF